MVSRVPRGAVLRLPSVSAERDAAVVAANVTNAELAGFRIVGDAATPLGVGVSVRDSVLRIVDVAVTGATLAALDLGAGRSTDGPSVVIGGDFHDNSGSGAIVRTGAWVRLAHNEFKKNAFSERAPAAIHIERDAKAEWLQNVFHGLTPEAIAGTDAALRSSLAQANLFIPTPRPASTTRPPAGRGGRGQ